MHVKGGFTPQGRISLSQNNVLPNSDIATAGTVYYLPFIGCHAPVWNGVEFVYKNFERGLSLRLDSDVTHFGYHASGYNFDIFVIDVGGVLRLCTGPTWAFGSLPAQNPDIERSQGSGSTELTMLQGVMVNSNTITVRIGSGASDYLIAPSKTATYVGSIRTTLDGIATDTKRKRFTFNAYNPVSKNLYHFDEQDSTWVYSSVDLKQIKDSNLNQVEIFSGLTGVVVDVTMQATVRNDTSVRVVPTIGIGLNSKTITASHSYVDVGINRSSVSCRYTGPLGLGFNYISMLVRGAGSGQQTWYDDGSSLTGVANI